MPGLLRRGYFCGCSGPYPQLVFIFLTLGVHVTLSFHQRMQLPGRQNETVEKPNIIFCLVDDLGWEDVGWRENTDVQQATPFITQLALQGIRLNQQYVHMVCSPTRAQFLTGRYAFRTGFNQGTVVSVPTEDGLALDEVTLATELKSHGYTTGIFGKWHLGNSHWMSVPNQRGFDVFSGYYGGGMGFWSKKSQDYIDLHADNDADVNEKHTSETTYSQYIYRDAAVDFLREHKSNQPDSPFFLYYAMQTVHSPLEAPEKWLSDPVCSGLDDKNRRLYCAMLLTTDECFEDVVNELRDLAFDHNTLVVFSADNGGNPSVGGYNMPLRGKKGSLFDGGIRGAAFVWGEMIPATRRGTEYAGLMHVTDWLPSLLTLATGSPWTPTVGRIIDGMDVLSSVFTGADSPRQEVVHQYCSARNCAGAIRIGDYKLIVQAPELGWFPTPDTNATGSAPNSHRGNRTSHATGGRCAAGASCETVGRQELCNYLFNMATDPTETTNLYALPVHNERVESMTSAYNSYADQEAPCAQCGDADPRAEAVAAQTGYWAPWLGEKPKF